MAAFVTPSQLSTRSDFYYQLANLISAGIPIINALDSVIANPPARSYVTPLENISEDLKKGLTFAEALERRGKWMTLFDLALVEAGEKSGRLDQSLHMLATFYRDQAELVKQVLSKLTYPFFLCHFALLIFPMSSLTGLILKSEGMAYLNSKLAILVPAYLVVFALLYLTNSNRGEGWRSILEQLFAKVPILGKARQNLAVARVCATLEALISAGVGIIESWRMAANASGSPAVKAEVAVMLPKVEQGVTPAEWLRGSRYFPELFKSMYNTGEISGTLDKDLKRLYKIYSEEALRGFTAIADWSPKIVFFIVAIGVAISVVGFYQDYFGQMNQLMQ